MSKFWIVALAVLFAFTATALGSDTTNIELVLDVSGSMTETVPGGVKIDVARQAVNQLLQQLPSSYNVGLRVYGHRYEQSDATRSCTDTELLAPLKPLTAESRVTVSQRLAGLQPKGLTPIAYTLQSAVNDFASVSGANFIILVSDGEETCDGDPLAVADWIMGLGIGLKVFVVGFDVDSRVQLQGIATKTGGLYYNARDAIELGRALQQAAWDATSVFFLDDFTKEMSPAWRTASVGNAHYGVSDGTLAILDGPDGQILTAFVGSPTWDDYVLSADIGFDRTDCNHQVGFFFRVQDTNNMVGFFFRAGGDCGFRIMRRGIWGDFLTVVKAPEAGAYHIAIVVQGTSYSAALNNNPPFVSTTDTTFSTGYIGLQSAVGWYRSRVHFDNVMVTPLE